MMGHDDAIMGDGNRTVIRIIVALTNPVALP